MFLPNILSLHLFSTASTIIFSILSNLRETGIFYLSVKDGGRWQKSIDDCNKEGEEKQKQTHQRSYSVNNKDFFYTKILFKIC